MRFKDFLRSVMFSVMLNLLIMNLIFGVQRAFSGQNLNEQTLELMMRPSIKKEGKFLNYHQEKNPTIAKGFKLMWKFLFNDNQRKPKQKPPVQMVNLEFFKQNSKDFLSSTWLGHSSLMINIDGYRLLTDPVLEKKVSFFGPSRYNGEAPVKPDSLPEIDLVLISHNHYDHLNKFSIKALQHKVKWFLVPLGVKQILLDWDVPEEKVVELDWWQEWNYNDELKIVFTPTQHFSGRGLFDRNETLWGSFVVKGPVHKIFYGGDSGYFDGFKVIGQQFGPFDLTFLECGAYNAKDWPDIHMLPEQTVQAHLDLKGRILHPIHWGTFNLAFHRWNEPMERVTEAAAKNGVQLATPIVGQSVVFPDQIPNEAWWKIDEQKEMKTALSY